MTRVIVVVLALAACGKGDSERREPARTPFRVIDAPPPVFAPNKGGEILAREGVVAGERDGDDWPGRWTGTQYLVGGPMTGSLGVDMEITRMPDGRIRLEQSAFGITVIQELVESPDNPTVAAGINYDSHHVSTVTFTNRQEIMAIRTGDQLVIGMFVDTEDPGSYQGTPLPRSPPQESLLRLERKTRVLPPLAPDAP